MHFPREHEEAESTAAPLPEQGEAVDIWEFASDSVAEILECADIAVEAIVDRAEQQVLEDIRLAEARASAETERRRAHLHRLRHDLANRATDLYRACGEIVGELEAVDRALAALEAPDQPAAPPAAARSVMTVRERHRFHFAGQPPPAADEAAAAEVETAPRPPVHNSRIPWRDAA